ncbi:TetR/AcrR family transcriptional regulator [Paenibacillus chungangensis]|uniref:TetR/AcrR family transcriptional regulator n=1 Tax=Paenibacillus chungangensis TaxID=696535 RepID=A0ABW3HRP8_9BACL
MPKKFTDDERNWIRQKLLKEGRRLFAAYGLKKTSIGDLTTAVGVAQGSFYHFFASKEELYYTLMLEDEKRIRDTILSLFPPNRPVTKEVVAQFLRQSVAMIEESPLLRSMMAKRELEPLLRKLPTELLQRNFEEDRDALLPLISGWQASGFMAGERTETIVSMIRALVLLTMHREEIGEVRFPATMELLIDVLAEGMIAKSRREGE